MRRTALLVTALLLLVTGCTAPIAASPSPALTLEGTSWLVTQINGTAVLKVTTPTMDFADGRVSGNNSCNQYSGAYTLNGTQFSVDQPLNTQMACAPDVMAQEQAFMAGLVAVTQVRTSETGLEMLDPAGAVVLRLAPAPTVSDKPLTGTEWQLTTFVKNEAAESLVAGSSISMMIEGDQLQGKACNTYGGTVTQDGSSFTVGPLRSTRMACTEEGVMEQEARYLALLETVTTMQLEADTLTLTAPDGQALVYSTE